MTGQLSERTATQPPASSKRTWADLRWRGAPVGVPWLVALLMLVVSVALYPSSIGFGGLATMTPLLGVLIIASLGQSLVIGTGGIDLSVSSVVTVVGVIFVMEAGSAGGSVPLALVYSLAAGLICGVVNGVLVEYLALSPLVSTLATGQIMAGLANIWYGGGANRLAVPPDWRSFTGSTFGRGISYLLLAAVVLVALASVVLSYTAVGRRLTAASTSPEAGRYQGIAVRRYRAATYVLASLLYSVAGVFLVGSIGTPTLSLGDVYQLSTIVVVVLGGAALSGGRLHPGATMAGALFLSLINQDVAATGAAAGTQGVIQGAVLVLAMLATSIGALRALLRRRRTNV
ncbi:ABC transporter permease [Cryptosporangium japonicum]|uniref:ABC transporter permease n=1 Tax=Cryptosporangium japonicum TaxID=80872 RepID=A0ABN0UQ30_9ACTN